jgi:FtsP/CotA-like multicopper oxidase with cupredoxin domain
VNTNETNDMYATDALPAMNAQEGRPMSAVTPEGVQRQLLSRRNFLRLAGGTAAGAVFWKFAPSGSGGQNFTAVASGRPQVFRDLAGTDGWVAMPAHAKAQPPFFPDPAAPAGAGATTYVFGFRNVSGLFEPVRTAAKAVADTTNRRLAPGLARALAQAEATAAANLALVRNHAQISAPLMWFREGDDVQVTLHNLGLANRPDLFDSHTMHWHGFPNAYPYFDGVPDASLSVPIGSQLTYRFLVDDAGTYMYHCHVEDVEHVNMGMNGMLFVSPKMGDNFLYNDATTKFDRQFCIHLSEIDVHAHYNDSQVQDTDWTDYTPTFGMMNGRAYPDTLAPNTFDPTTASADPRLNYQPLSSVIEANSGETVAIRLSNLGYEEHSLVLPGLPLKLVGIDGKFIGAGRGNLTDNGYTDTAPYAKIDPSTAPRGDVTRTTYRIDIGPGESRDLLFVAPVVTQKTVFPFYDRTDTFTGDTSNSAGAGLGGMRTEVRIYPSGLPAQTRPHQSFLV